MYREECEPVRRGRKLRMAVAGWRSRRSRPSVTPDPSRSARVRPASIEQGTPIMARSSSAIPDGDRGDGTALSRWLPSARLAVSIDPSPTPHPHHVHDECAGRRRSYGGSCISRAYSRTSGQPGFHGTSLEARSRDMDGNASKRTGSRHAFVQHTGAAVEAGLVPCALPAASARCRNGFMSAARRRCNAPLNGARRNVLRPSRGGVGPGIFQGLLHLRPEPAVMAGRVRVRCRCLSV